MFGQAPAPSPFGTPGTTQGGTSLFGAPAAPAFGSPAPAPAFGASAATPSAGGFGFGSPAPAPATGFGGFGSATPAPAPSGFGAFGAPAPAPAFGAQAPATPFGAPAPAPSTGLFGSTPAPATSGGLFGGGAATTTTGFGSAAPTSAFGTTAPTSAFGSTTQSTFGAPTPAPSAFGTTSTFGSSPAPSTGLFGAPAPAPTSTFGAPAPAFGAPAPSGGLFGAPAPATGTSTGLFGAAAQGVKPGTLQTPYSDTRIVDNNSQITFKSISGMQAYSNSSFEELRIADYMAGNKGAQGQNVGGTSAFGSPAAPFGSPAPAPAGGLFGGPTAAPTTTFGAPATSAFGSTPATTFGSPAAAPSAFGAPAPSGGLFGAPAPASTAAFGSPAAAPSAFGAPAPSGGLFGAPAPAPSTGLFGSAPAAPAPSTGFSFGSTTPAAAPSAFGAAPTSGGLFGSTPAPASSGGLFGSSTPAPASGGLFGAPAPAPASGGLFGAPAPAPTGGLFGAPAPAPTGGLFGAPAPAPTGGGLFGTPAPAPAGGLFGAPAPAPSAGLFGAPAPKPAGGLFGSPAPAGGGLFSSTTQTPAFGAAPASSSVFGATTAGAAPVATTSVLVPPSADTLLAHQLAAVETQKKEMAVLEALRGTSPGNRSSSSSGSVIPTSIFQRDAAAVRYRGLAGSGGSSHSTSTYPSQIAPKSTAKVRPRGFGPPTPSTTLHLTNSQTRIKPMTPSAFIGSATKHLVIKAGSLTPKPKMRLLLSDEATESNGKLRRGDSEVSQSPLTNGVIRGSVIDDEKSKTPLNQTKESSTTTVGKLSPFDVSKIANEEAAFTSPDAVSANQRISKEAAKSTSGKKKKSPKERGDAYDYYRTVIGSPQLSEEKTQEASSPKTYVPKLSMDGYVVTPSLSILSQMSEADLATVSNFSVEKVGVGSVAWDGAVDVRGIDLDSIISIEMKDVAVYQKQEEMGTKPPEGTKLNRSAIITFHGVYPKDGPESSKEMKKKFDGKLQKHAKSMGAEFIIYDSDKGIWMFRVPHFSRYALVDDSDDEKEEDESSHVDFESGVDGGSTRSRTLQGKIKKPRFSRIRVPLNEDEEMVDCINEGEAVDQGDEKYSVLEAAEAAYQKMTTNYDQLEATYIEKKRSIYANEGETISEYHTDVSIPSLRLYSNPLGKFSICDKVALQCGIKLNESSSIDFSRRLGRSFRVGWTPNGSLLFPKKDGKIAQLRPLTDPCMPSVRLLSAHQENSIRISSCDNGDTPFFCIPGLTKNVSKTHLLDTTKLYKHLYKQISSQKGREDTMSIVGHAFALIQILFLGSKSNDKMSRDFTALLRDLCQTTNKQNISGDPLYSIFDALSSGNLEKASLIARREGYFRLSSIIANESTQSMAELEAQIHAWIECGSEQFMPLHLYRIFSLLSGDLKFEVDLYESSGPTCEIALDWKRRLVMLDKCENVSSQGASQLFNLIQKYSHDVEEGKAPSPNAWYIDPHEAGSTAKKNTEHICILYRLMRLYCDESTGNNGDVGLSYIVSPLGHTSHVHDVSNSFHLASILSSLELQSCSLLSECEECKLLESYALSLVNSGDWEWATYVILCTFNSNGVSKEIAKWKHKTALEIICKNFCNSSASKQKRKFLETKLGIPEKWFDIAMSFQSIESIHKSVFKASDGVNCSPQLKKMYESMILPEAFFDADGDKSKTLLSYLENIQDEEDLVTTTFGALLLEYLSLSQQVIDLSYGTLASNDFDFDGLVARSEAILLAIPKVRFDSGIGHENSVLPSSVVLLEFDSAVRSLIVQLNILKSGGSILENQNIYDTTEKKVLKIMSKLAYELTCTDSHQPSTVINTTQSSSLLRGKCGIGVTISS